MDTLTTSAGDTLAARVTATAATTVGVEITR